MKRLLVFRPHLRPLWPRLWLLAAAVLFASLIEGAGIGLFYPLIQFIESPTAFWSRPSARIVASILAAAGLEPSAGLFIGLIFCVIAAGLGLKYAVARLSAAVYDPLMKSVRDEALRRILSSHIFYFLGSSSAALNQILENDVEHLGQSLNFAVAIASASLTIAVYAALAAFMSWKLTLLIAFLGALRYVVSGLFIRRMRALGEEHAALRTRLRGIVTALHQGIDVVKSFGAERRELTRFEALTTLVRSNSERIVSSQAANAFFESLLGDGLLCGVVWLAVSRFGVSGAALLTFLFIVSRIAPKVTVVNDGRIRISEYLGRMTLLPDIFSESGLPELAWGSTEKTSFDREIVLTNVSFAYPGAVGRALLDIDLTLARGEALALVGESGAGKSTLARLLLRLFDPTAGVVTIDGAPLPSLRKEDWTRLIGVVSQDTFIFDDTLENNVKYGAPHCSESEFRRALKRARADEFVARLPKKEKTELGERGVRLSGGQRQRVAISRAFLRDSPILVLDEATSAMDSVTEGLIQDALDELSKDRTMLIIAHRLATVRGADRIAVLEDGRLAELGTHADLLARQGLYRRFHDLQTRV